MNLGDQETTSESGIKTEGKQNEYGGWSILYIHVCHQMGKSPKNTKGFVEKIKNLSESSSPFRTSKMHKKKTPTPFNIVYPFHVQESFATSMALT